MITEDYVSFETAKLLKESGFNVPCRSNYRSEYYKDHRPFYHNFPKDFNGKEYENLNSEWYSAPTLQMAMKWLREVHHVACFICSSIEQGFHTNKWNSYIDKLSDNFPKDPLWFVETSDSYEQACEAAIKYCLKNLI